MSKCKSNASSRNLFVGSMDRRVLNFGFVMLLAEGLEFATLLLQHPENGTLGAASTATLEITDNASEGNLNPIDNSETFVCGDFAAEPVCRRALFHELYGACRDNPDAEPNSDVFRQVITVFTVN
jgi:hypothetical protein